MLELEAQPASVPAARRYVRQSLAGHHEDVIDAAEVCISELVTNAVLHARTQIEVRVADAGEQLRLEVRDRSTVVPRRLVHTARSATGRGMELVTMLAESWGVDLAEDDSKVVWCLLPTTPPPPVDAQVALAAWADESLVVPVPEPVAAGDHVPRHAPAPAPQPASTTGPVPTGGVVLLGYPVRRGIRAREHANGMLRECALLSQMRGFSSVPARLMALAQSISSSYAGELAIVDNQRTRAFLEGRDTVDVHYPIIPDSRRLVEAWVSVTAELDAFAAQNALLTLETPPDLLEFNAWVAQEFIGQAEGRAPQPWRGGLD